MNQGPGRVGSCSLQGRHCLVPLFRASGRKLEKFTVSVNVAAGSKVTFELTYEELLKRHKGKYEMYLKVQPKQLVKHFEVISCTPAVPAKIARGGVPGSTHDRVLKEEAQAPPLGRGGLGELQWFWPQYLGRDMEAGHLADPDLGAGPLE